MKKIAIIGSPGAGKTSLAESLGHILDIKVYYLDRIFWKGDWQGIDTGRRIDILEHLVQREQWIIEGTYLLSSEPRLREADTIIFLDTPSSVCLLRIIQRHRKDHGRLRRDHTRFCGDFAAIRKQHRKDHGRLRRDLPDGCTDRLTPSRMWRVLAFPFNERRKLKKQLREFPPEKAIMLRSPKDVRSFLAQLEQHVQEKRPLAKTPALHEHPSRIIRRIFSHAFCLFRRDLVVETASAQPAAQCNAHSGEPVIV